MRVIVDILKLIISIFLSFIVKKYSKTNLVCERGYDARDNGYNMFEYLVSIGAETTYVITKTSYDYKKIKKIGKSVEFNSIKHGVAFLNSKNLICTHSTFCAPTWKGVGTILKFWPKLQKGKKIFLQHGIIKDWLPMLTSKYIHPDLFICGAKPEYDYVLKYFGFSDKIVKYTGLARFDDLYDAKTEKYILFMPTWRTYLKEVDVNKFIKTNYFNKIWKVLQSKEIINSLKIKKWKLIFYPHIEMQKYIENFVSNNAEIIIANAENYDIQSLIRNCGMLITDYSSVFFDVAYMKKPIIFYQFDLLEYRNNHYEKGYFDYNNSFGTVVNDIDSLIKLLKNDNSYTMNDYQKSIVDTYFLYHDCNNKVRIYEEIQKLR